MSDFGIESSSEIERLFLWEELVGVFEKNAFRLGIQATFDFGSIAISRLVLAEVPDNKEDSLQLWATVSAKAMIESVSLIYNDPQGREVFNYELTAETMKQYSPEPTPLDQEDIMDIRLDVAEATWDAQRSADCARELMFFS